MKKKKKNNKEQTPLVIPKHHLYDTVEPHIHRVGHDKLPHFKFDVNLG